MENYRWFVCILFASTLPANSVLGSQESIGAMGINSVAIPLNGDGIPIGQVEGERSGKWDYDLPANSSEFIDPLFVLRQDMTSMPNNDIDDHATWVAGVMISSEPTGQIGVAPGAALVSAGFRSPNAGIGPHEDILTTTQAVARRFLDETLVRAINHSYGFFSSDPGRSIGWQYIFYNRYRLDCIQVRCVECYRWQ